LKIRTIQFFDLALKTTSGRDYVYFDRFLNLIKYGVILTTVYVYKWLLGDINVELAGHPYLCHENKLP